MLFESLESRQVLSTFSVINANDSGAGSLRQAILDANANSGPDLINFNIPGGGLRTIAPLSALPTITSPVVIDGYTQPGSSPNTQANSDNAVLTIELNGTSAGTTSNGLWITAGDSTVKGLVINRFKASGIRLDGGDNNFIAGNFIGTEATAMVVNFGRAQLNGVEIVNGSSQNIIGTNGDGSNDLAERNVLSNNNRANVFVSGNGTNDNVIAGNFIGVNASGTGGFNSGTNSASCGVGIWMDGGAQSNLIGTDGDGIGDTAERNVISKNVGHSSAVSCAARNTGVFIGGATTTPNIVAGNYIGTDPTGTFTLSNPNSGIKLKDTHDIRIGTNADGIGDAAERNVISGNVGAPGILLENSTNISIAGNYIGTDATGSERLNNSYGVRLIASSDNTIGGTVAAARNVISGNSLHGILADSLSNHNLIQGNFVGTDAAGMISLRLAGYDAGITIDGGQFNKIGGDVPGARNLISGNYRGIEFLGQANTALVGFNIVEGNWIGTDVTGIGFVRNYEGVYIENSDGNRIGGTTPGARNVISGNFNVSIHIFCQAADRDPAFVVGNIIQGNWIGVDATGNGLLGSTQGGISVRFAQDTIVGGTAPGAGNIIADNEGDGISVENSVDTVIQGNIIGQTLNGSPAGQLLDGVNVFQSQGTLIGGDVPEAANIIANNGRSYGPAVNLASRGPGGVFVSPDVNPRHWWRAEQNAIDSFITGTGANGTLQGGATFAQGKFGYGFSFDGVDDYVNIPDSPAPLEPGTEFSWETWIRPNRVDRMQQIISKFGPGGDAYQLGLAPNGVFQVQVNTGGVIKTLQSPAGAIVAGEWSHVGMTYDTNPKAWRIYVNGVEVASRTDISTVFGSGTTPVSFGRKSDGTEYFDGLIDEPAMHSGVADIATVYGLGGAAKWHGTTIRGNNIFDSGDMGIDLSPHGPNPIDSGDTDIGANDWQNPPVITSAISNGTQIKVEGTLRSIAFASYSIDIFANSEPPPRNAEIEGEQFLGSGTAVTDATGNATFSFTFDAAVPAGYLMSGTATVLADHDSNPDTPLAWFHTSEFSGYTPVVQGTIDSGSCHVPITSGLVSCWTGNGDALDHWDSNHGTLENGAGYAPGKFGQAFNFDGINDFVLVPDDPSLQFGGSTPMSISLWANRTGAAGVQHLIGKRGGCGGNFYQMAFDNNGLAFGSQSGAAYAGSQLEFNEWKHIVGTFDGSAYRIYVDGELMGTASGGGWAADNAPLTLGTAGSCGPFGGLLDEIAIYDRALGDHEVRDIFKDVISASIKGQEFNDLNGDGIKDVGEPGLQNWTVYIDSNANNALDPGEPRTLTDENGNYSIGGLDPGTYRVRSEHQFGWMRTTADPADVVVTLPAEVIEEIDFGDLSIAASACTAVGEDKVSCYPANNDALDYWDGNDGILVNGATYAPGIVGEAFSFTGNNHVEVADAANLRFGFDSPMTIEMWAFRTGPGGVMHLLGKRGGCGASDFYQMAFDSGGLGFGGSGGSVGAGEQLPQYRWTHLAATFDGETFKFYVNGELKGTASGQLAAPNFAPLEIGNSGTCAGFVGLIDEIAIYGRALTPEEINPSPANRVSGVKFHDLNGDGNLSPGEPGLSGFTIYIDANQNNAHDPGERASVSDIHGNWSFTNLPAGMYHVREAQEPGWSQTSAPLDVTLTDDSQSIDGLAIGNYRLARISGAKFEDANANGMPDSNEHGLAGWTIFLDANDNGELDASETSTVTNLFGAYTFDSLTAGTYRVREVQQPGWTQTTPNEDVEVVPNQSAQSYTLHVGNFRPSSIIGGIKFHDLDGNGVHDSVLEPGLPNWTIQLDIDADGTVDATTTTNSDGEYAFHGLPVGTYRIREGQQTGWVQTTADPEDVVIIDGGQTIAGPSFGNYRLATISGTKFNDANTNGVLDAGEHGLEGWTIFLDDNDNGALDGGETSTTTNIHGSYSFGSLVAGTYLVREVQQPGWTQTSENQTVHVLEHQSAQSYVVNIGNFRLGTIDGGAKYHDLNGNGLREAGEPGLQGWTIYLDTNSNNELDSNERRTISDVNGNWSFSDLPAGTYPVREVQGPGWIQTSAPYDLAVTTSGQSVPGGAIGNYRLAIISGAKFNDVNGNGELEIGELGLEGWTIFLDDNDNGELDTGESSTTTNVFGHYSFGNLFAGTYRVREVQQPGWTQTSANVVTEVLPHQSAQSYVVNVGNFRLGTIDGGIKFHDLNGDGDRDFGEPGLPGFTIYLDNNGNDMLDVGEPRTISGVNGEWSFANLPKGTYHVREVQQSGWVQTTAPLDLHVTTSGESVSGGEIGNFRLATITGVKFNDLDGDGIRDAGEPGIEGWQIFLDLDGDNQLDTNERSEFTNISGVYTFSDVLAGTWHVREVQQAGWVQTTQNPPGVVVTGLDQNYHGGDFGNFKKVEVCGSVFHDFDNSGDSDSGEAGLGGRTIFIDVNNNGVLDPGEPSTVTDSNGNYCLEDVGPGLQPIRQETPPGWVPLPPIYINPPSGTDIPGIDFANRRDGTPAKITGGGSIVQSTRNFGFVVMPKTQQGTTTYFGNLEYQDKSLNINLKSDSITFINVEPDRIHGQFAGTASINGVTGYRFFVEVEDRAEPGALIDIFRIRISGPNGFSYDSNAACNCTGTLAKGGNIQIHKPGQSLTQATGTDDGSGSDDSTQSSPLFTSSAQLLQGVLTVAVDDAAGVVDSLQRDRIADAILTLNHATAALGTTLIQDSDSVEGADIVLRVAFDSPCGSAADGVLGCTSDSNTITLLVGWSWYAGADSDNVGVDQFDYQTVVTHELGHAIGLGHSGDSDSVMYSELAMGVARRDLSASDLANSDADDDSDGSEALVAQNHIDGRVGSFIGRLSTDVTRAAAVDAILAEQASQTLSISDDSFETGVNHSSDFGGDILVGGDGDDLQIGSCGQDQLVGGIASVASATRSQLTEPAKRFHHTELTDEALDDIIAELTLGQME